MKVTSVLLLLFFIVASSNANPDNLFTYDKNAVNQQLSEVTKVEKYVETHQGVSLDQLQSENNSLLSNVNLHSSSSFADSEGPLGIPSFLWGCVLSWVGILIVYLITQDSEETKKALYGCIVGTLSGCLLYILFWVVILSAEGGLWYWY